MCIVSMLTNPVAKSVQTDGHPLTLKRLVVKTTKPAIAVIHPSQNAIVVLRLVMNHAKEAFVRQMEGKEDAMDLMNPYLGA